jgi:hypothetical protein
MGERPAFSMADKPMQRFPSRWVRTKLLPACLALSCTVMAVSAANLDDLLGQKDLTPEGLARVISDFSFEITPQLQEPNSFLRRKCGDCADFANLASLVLTHRGYTTKLVVVMMSKQTHVVCYVKEAGGFLDYNHRADANPVVVSDGSLEDIAGKVAGDFRSDWRMASFFRYRQSSPVFLDSVFATESSRKRSVIGRSHREAKVTGSPASATVTRTDQGPSAPVAVQAIIN